MVAYVIRRLLLLIPTLFAIMLINFLIVQAAPGGPIDVVIAEMRGLNIDAAARISGSGQGDTASSEGGPSAAGSGERSRAARGLDPAILKELEKQFGFDKPLGERFVLMMTRYLTFDFGKSYFKGGTVMELVRAKLPVSISLGLWTTLITYLVCIPLGVAKAVRDGSRFDIWSSGIIIAGAAIPSFLFAVLLIVLFAGSSFLQIFPLRGLTSTGFADMPWWKQVLDYAWHMTLPLTAMIIGAFAGLTILTKNSFLEEIRKQYVVTARAKGLTERRV
ncbi:MAG: ABC transporter permease subunit, partial [Alphaproteobacteria bacterium]|nr:ABC transporter permease subunit [Alphaproteobacteria bacterium]